MKKKRVKFSLAMLALGAALLACCAVALCVGSVPISLKETLGVLINALTGLSPIEYGPQTESILLLLRLPRVLLAALIGASLSVAGGAMQGLIKNPLADGSTLGVTSGGSLGAVICITLGLRLASQPQLSITVVSIAFSFASLLLILGFVKKVDRNLSSNTIILAGVIFSMLASAVTSLIISFAGDNIQKIVFWSMGSLAGRGYQQLAIMAVCAVIGITGTLLSSRELDAFAMGEEQAAYAGVNVRGVRVRVLALVSLLCGAAVSICGNVAFVGLAVPHIVRMLVGPAHTRLLPASALCGGIFLVLCDLCSRTLLSPLELPIGVLTSILGAAVFIAIFYRQRKEG